MKTLLILILIIFAFPAMLIIWILFSGLGGSEKLVRDYRKREEENEIEKGEKKSGKKRKSSQKNSVCEVSEVEN